MLTLWLYHSGHNPLFRLYFRAEVYGAEHVPKSGGFVLAPNHASFIDPWLMVGASKCHPIRYLINESWYNRSALWRYAFRSCGVIPAAKDPVETIKRVVTQLRAGDIVGLFPEGRISKDGQLSRVQHGIGWIAALSGAPVVPCGLRGNFDLLPRSHRIPRPGRFELHHGPPLIFPGSPTDNPDLGQIHEFTCEVARQIARLADRPLVPIKVFPRAPATDIRPLLQAST